MNKLEVKERVINKLKKEIEILSNLSETDIEEYNIGYDFHGTLWSVGKNDWGLSLTREYKPEYSDGDSQFIHFGDLDEESEGNVL